MNCRRMKNNKLSLHGDEADDNVPYAVADRRGHKAQPNMYNGATRFFQRSQSLQQLPSVNTSTSQRSFEGQQKGNMSAFEKRKLYDIKIRGVAASTNDLSTSADDITGVRSSGCKKNMKPRVKRTLPKLPIHREHSDIEDKKEELSFKVISQVRNKLSNCRTVAGSVTDLILNNEHSDQATHHTDLPQEKTDIEVIYDNEITFLSPVQNNYGASVSMELQGIPSPNSPQNAALRRMTSDLHKAVNNPSNMHSRRNSASSWKPYPETQDVVDVPFRVNERAGLLSSTNTSCNPCSAEQTRSCSKTDSTYESRAQTSHPALHKILQHCSVHSVTVHRNGMEDFGLVLFESVFSTLDNGETGNRRMFRSPGGRCPVIGQRRGAFLPVSTASEDGPRLSLVAVDYVKHGTKMSDPGAIREGDFIIEVNSEYVGSSGLEKVQRHVTSCLSDLHLVVARYNRSISQTKENTEEEQSRMNEKLQLKYNSLQQDADRYLDMIADIKLQVRDAHSRIQCYETELKNQETALHQLKQQLSAKDEEILEWQKESCHSHTEIERLEFEGVQREEHILELRQLLVQQTDLLQLQGYDDVYGGLGYEGEKVSAV